MEEKRAFDRLFRALGDKHRLYILDLLMQSELNAGQLLEAVDVVQSTLSHHMKTLTDSGLVNARKEGKWTYYQVNGEAVEEARFFLLRYMQQDLQPEAVQDTSGDPEPEQESAFVPVSPQRKQEKSGKRNKNGKKKDRGVKDGGKKKKKR